MILPSTEPNPDAMDNCNRKDQGPGDEEPPSIALQADDDVRKPCDGPDEHQNDCNFGFASMSPSVQYDLHFHPPLSRTKALTARPKIFIIRNSPPYFGYLFLSTKYPIAPASNIPSH